MASADFPRNSALDSPSPDATPQNADAAQLRARLEALAKRRNAHTLQHEIAVCATLGASVCAPLLLSHRLQLIDLNFAVPIAILAFSAGAGILRGRARRIGAFEAALDADRALGLDERLSSALAFSQPAQWRLAQTRSAQTRSAQTRSAQTRSAQNVISSSRNAKKIAPKSSVKSLKFVFDKLPSREATAEESSTRFITNSAQNAKVPVADSRAQKSARFSWRDLTPQNRRSSMGAANANSANATYAAAINVNATSPNATSTFFVPALVRDATERVRVLDAKTVYPPRFERAAKAFLIAFFVVLALFLMPDLSWLRTPDQQKTAAILKKQGDELDQIAKPILRENVLPESSQTKKMAAKMEALARKMQRGRMGKEDALLGIGQLRRDLEKAVQTPQNQSEPSKPEAQRLREALQNQQMQSAEGQQMQQNMKRGDLQKAADNLEKMADKMDKGRMTPQEKQQAAADLKKTAEALRKNGQNDAAQKLENAARSLEKQAKNQNAQSQKNGAQKSGEQKNGEQPNGAKDGQNAGAKSGGNGAQKQQSGQNGSPKSGAQNGKPGQNSGRQQQGQSAQKGGNSPQNQGSQQGQNSQQQGSSTQSGGAAGQNSAQNDTGSGSQALRDMAKNLRQGEGAGQSNSPGESKSLQRMLDKIKEAEKNTGQNSGAGQQQGQGGGQQPGQNAGQSVTPGKDLMPSDPHGAVGGGAGLGPRSHAQGSQSGGGVSKIKGARTGDKRRWQDVWTDRLPKTRKNIDRITGKLGDSGEMQQLPTKTEAKGGSARTPYYNVYESYKKDAEDAVAKDSVPPAYKQPVKNYFESLKP